MGKLFKFIGQLLTLGILPGAYGLTEGTYITGNHTVWIIGWLINPIINYFIEIFLNLMDFVFLLTIWIPYIGDFQTILYLAPDIDQMNYNAIYEFLYPLIGSSHRNWLTHSVLNPYFIAFIIISFIIAFISQFIPVVKYIVAFIIFIIGFSFICHLLADTMPKGWGKDSRNNFANIHFRFWFIKFQMNGFFSKLWLYINIFIGGAGVLKSVETAAAD